MRANVENIKSSIVNHKVDFNCGGFGIKEVMKFRRANMSITNMLWITKSPVIDCGYTLYNPKALIMIILN